MNELFARMNSRLNPSPEAVEELYRRAEGTGKARPRWGVYLAAAACLALAAAYPMSRYLARPLHPYSVAGTSAAVTEERHTLGERDRETPAEVGSEDAGGEQEVRSTGEADPEGGSQERAQAAYENLTAYFREHWGEGRYPDWYGGAYMDPVLGDALIICVVDPPVDAPGDKEFYLQVEREMAGSQFVGFREVKYSYAHLRALQEQVTDLLRERGDRGWGCGVHETDNCLELDIPEADSALLAALHDLDPEGDAILVRVGTAAAVLDLEEG